MTNVGLRFSSRAAAAVALLLSLAAGHAQAQSYRLTPLGEHVDVSALNDLGQVVGNDASAGGSNPYLWSGGVTTTLGSLGAVTANDINNLGQITGAMAATDPAGASVTHAYRYVRGSLTDLDPNGLGSSGAGINGSGVVAGYYTPADGHVRSGAATFSNGAVQELNVPPSSNGNSSASAINDHGVVTGSGGGGSGRFEPFVYSNGTATPLGNFGGMAGHGLGINAAGTVVGDAETLSFASHAFVYSHGVKTDLDPTNRFSSSSANAINDAGLIVGTGATSADSFAFIYSGGQLLDLNKLLDPVSGAGWHLLAGIDVNNLGQIVGYGINGAGQERAFLLAPVPEPATVAMMLAGLAALAWVRRRRQPTH